MDRDEPLLRRIRWPNVVVALGALSATALVALWPRLAASEPLLPPDAGRPRPVVTASPEPVAARAEPAPEPAAPRPARPRRRATHRAPRRPPSRVSTRPRVAIPPRAPAPPAPVVAPAPIERPPPLARSRAAGPPTDPAVAEFTPG
jgi:hypothetical protein